MSAKIIRGHRHHLPSHQLLGSSGDRLWKCIPQNICFLKVWFHSHLHNQVILQSMCKLAKPLACSNTR